jgi:hypothetical protein
MMEVFGLPKIYRKSKMEAVNYQLMDFSEIITEFHRNRNLVITSKKFLPIMDKMYSKLNKKILFSWVG